MARFAIYHLYSDQNESVQYIGQGKRQDVIARPLEHFSGLYHFKDGSGGYSTSTGGRATEGPLFVNGLHTICLKDVRCTIGEGGDKFGIPDEDGVTFARQGAPEEIYDEVQQRSIEVAEGKRQLNTFQDVKNLGGSGYYVVDAAEIMHIYKANASGTNLLQVQMGGQVQNGKNLNNSNVLNRDMSPSAMANIINGAHMSNVQAVQEAFNNAFGKQLRKSPTFIKRLNDAIKNEENLGLAIKEAVDDFLKEMNQKQTILQTIIRDVQNECDAHLINFGLQFPKGHADPDAISITFNTKEVQTLEKAIVNTIIAKKDDLEAALSKNPSLETLGKWIEKNVVGKISFGTFIKVNLKNITDGALSLTISGGTDYSKDLVPHLKMMSYGYYMHFANQYFSSNTYDISKSNYDLDDDGAFGHFCRVFGKTSCTVYVWQQYRAEGIKNIYTQSYAAGLMFNREMLTCYTKNNGNGGFDGRIIPSVLYKNLEEERSNPILVGYFDSEIETDDDRFYPFYKFSQTTGEYINAHFNDNILQLTYY